MKEKKLIHEKSKSIVLPVCLAALGVFCFIAMATIAGSIAAENIYITLGVIFIVLAVFELIFVNSCEICVTDKRIYGKAAFGKRVDLPLDSVSAVATGFLKSVSISTSSGRITFFLMSRYDEIHRCVSELLLDRQQKPVAATTIKQEIPQSNAEELRKYKELLDMGVITQEEFNAKKKQLLGL